MGDVAISADKLGKRYRIGGPQQRYTTLRESISGNVADALRRVRNPWLTPDGSEAIWALRDVSFEVRPGEAIGVIGRNGAGKTTLLKILSRITEPTEGRVTANGRVASLLEVGTGFHPELTGRENIYLNGAILGMRRVEIGGRFDEIVAFAEIERFLDTPVKHYSSGMYVRLAFAVAAHLRSDILLVDEVLAVGDMAFQKKCLGKMGEAGSEGRAVVLVSHSLSSIRQLSSRAIWLDSGRLMRVGPTEAVVEEYVLANVERPTGASLRDFSHRHGSGEITIVDFWVENEGGARVESVANGEPATFVFEYETQRATYRGVTVSLHVHTLMGDMVVWVHNRMTGQDFGTIPRAGQFRCHIPRFPLAAAVYTLHVHVSLHNGQQVVDDLEHFARMEVVDGDFYGTGYPSYSQRTSYLTDAVWSVRPGNKPGAAAI